MSDYRYDIENLELAQSMLMTVKSLIESEDVSLHLSKLMDELKLEIDLEADRLWDLEDENVQDN